MRRKNSKSSDHLSAILAKLMADNHLDAVQLSKQTGIPQTTINRMRANPNSNPTIATLMPLASFFAVSVSQLIGTEALEIDKDTGRYKTKQRTWVKVPLINWEEILTWPENMSALKERPETTWIYSDSINSDSAFALTAAGDAMSPRFPAGTILIIDPALKPENRDFVIAQLKGQKEPIFRQILMDGQECYLKSLNPEFKESYKVELNKSNKILGVMAQARMDFRQ